MLIEEVRIRCFTENARTATMVSRMKASLLVSAFLLAVLSTNVSSYVMVPHKHVSRVPSISRAPILTSTQTSDAGGDKPKPFFPTHYAGLAFDKYLDWCHRKPFRTKSISAGVILIIGDILAQSLEANRLGIPFALNIARTRGFALSGLFFEGPWMHFWYEQVWRWGRFLKRKYPHLSDKKLTLLELALDQTIGVLAFYPAYFYAYEIFHSLGCGHLPHLMDATIRLKKEILGVFMKQYYLWPAVSWFIFRYVPQQLRVLSSNSVNVLWNAYLCTRIAA